MAEKKQYESFVTPRVTAVWPHLNGPDTKYNKDGVWHTKAAVDPTTKEGAAFLSFLQERLDAHIEGIKETLSPKAKKTFVANPIITDELDDDGEETGRKIVSFKMYATGKDKQGQPKKREPRFFDAKGKKIMLAQLPRLASGSVLKIEYSISGYNTPKGSGITLYLSNVQVIEAVEYTGAGGSKFGDEGDGFQAGDDEAPSRFDREDAESSETSEDGDF